MMSFGGRRPPKLFIFPQIAQILLYFYILNLQSTLSYQYLRICGKIIVEELAITTNYTDFHRFLYVFTRSAL